MNTTYDIYSSLGFIGSLIIHQSSGHMFGGLLLFEAIPDGLNLDLIQSSSTQNRYANGSSHHQIILDLMTTAIPSIRTNGLTYHYFDQTGNQTTI